jgi:hypothetical protein
MENTVLTGLETDEPLPCISCSHHSKAVSRRTVLFMVKPECLEEALNGTFRLCPHRECAIVYFQEQGNRVFTVDDLRTTVGVKASKDPIPLCYCFGFDESHLREEIAETGTTTIPERISYLIREGLCACDVRNPSGKCCLGEVIRTAKKIADRSCSPGVKIHESFTDRSC